MIYSTIILRLYSALGVLLHLSESRGIYMATSAPSDPIGCMSLHAPEGESSHDRGQDLGQAVKPIFMGYCTMGQIAYRPKGLCPRLHAS